MSPAELKIVQTARREARAYAGQEDRPLTRFVAGIFTAVSASDFLQIAYDRAQP
jgi:hypothetical protein